MNSDFYMLQDACSHPPCPLFYYFREDEVSSLTLSNACDGIRQFICQLIVQPKWILLFYFLMHFYRDDRIHHPLIFYSCREHCPVRSFHIPESPVAMHASAYFRT
jgi:hypothetical protein